MNDLVAFINARYDEKELVANAADAARWQAQGGAVWDERNGSVVAGFTKVYPETAIELDEGDARHIALNDPAAALADVTMKRRLLEGHVPVEQAEYLRDEAATRQVLGCAECSNDENGYVERWPCRHVRLLGSEFDTHPDYQKGWAP